MPSFKCADIGMKCGFETSAATEEELMKKITAHAASVHNIQTVSPELAQKIKNAIKVEPMTR
ncbi:MAG: DUF1059 domain-containing protein [Candidatus Bathyarchaeota archaeon]|nr:DUF1059 domain-containing protein [Candidatus Bathyarchaeota archaeon]